MSLSSQRVLVTGGKGFLGRYLRQRLDHLSVEDVFAPSRAEYDLSNQRAVEHLLADTRPDVVIHLAAEVGGIGANRDNPGRYFYANAVMGINLIEASRAHGITKFVQVGTVCSYPKHTPVPFIEEDLWSGYPEETNAPYGIAKKALLVMLQAYRKQYAMSGIFLLPANLYGPGDNFDPRTSHVIPALIRRFTEAHRRKKSEVVVWGTGAASREFLHVQDAARAISMATAQYDLPDPVNVGSGQEITIRALAEMIADLTGFDGNIQWDDTKPDGQPRRLLDTTRAKELFGFEAGISLSDGLNETIAWWRDHGDS